MAEKRRDGDSSPGRSEDRGRTASTPLSRRGLLAGAAAGVLGVSGCSNDGGSGEETTAAPAPGTTTPLAADAPPINRTWPGDRTLPRFRAAESLDVVDVRGRPASEKLLYVTLQGAVNRRQTRLHVNARRFAEGPRGWLDTTDTEYTVRDDPTAVLDAYAGEVGGVIVYDPQVAATVNVATTAAGLAGGVVASPPIADQLVAEYDLEIRRDFRDRFESAFDAYRWQYDHLHDETTDRMLVGIPSADGRMRVTDQDQSGYETLASAESRDGAGPREVTLDLSPFLDADGSDAVYIRLGDADPSDGTPGELRYVTVTTGTGKTVAEFAPGTDVEDLYLYDADGSSAERTGASAGYRRASRQRYAVYEFSLPEGTTELTARLEVAKQFSVSATGTRPPAPDERPVAPFPLLRDYAVANAASVVWLDLTAARQRRLLDRYLARAATNSAYLGWCPEGVAGEFSGVELCARHTVAVAPADYFENMSVFSGLRTGFDPEAPPAPPTPELESKVYLLVVMSDGDNLQYDQHRLRELWDQDARGEAAINWSISPLLVDAAPALLSYYLRTATTNDVLMCGPSGAGYTYPAAWPDDEFRRYTERTGAYLDRMGVDSMSLLNREGGSGVPLSEAAVAAYGRDVDPAGLYLPGDTAKVTDRQGVRQATGPYVSSVDGFVETVREQTPSDWSGERPVFVPVAPITWNMDTADVVSAIETLGDEYEALRADHFFDLWESSQN